MPRAIMLVALIGSGIFVAVSYVAQLILEGREVVPQGGQTHSIENLRQGDSLEGWSELFGIGALPFTHNTAGAISGDWYAQNFGNKAAPPDSRTR